MSIITGTSATETLTGTADADTISGLGGDDSLNGAGGNDLLDGGTGNNALNGGAGLDVASYANSTTGVTVTLTNHAGTVDHDGSYSDTLAAIEQVTGSAFDDTFTSNTRFQSGTSYGVRDTLAGGAGNDSYWITYGSNGGTLNGAYVLENANEGIDTVHTTFTYTLTANVENMVVEATTGVTGTGNGLDNSIIGNAGNDQLIGAAGNDYISGDDGDDVLNGGTGSDTLVGGNGTDIAAYDEATTAVTIDRYHGIYTGEAAGDVYIGIEGFRGSDNNDNFVLGVENLTLNGGAGLDVASYANSTTGVTVTLTNHAGTVDHDGSYSDTLAAIEQVTGSAFDDTFTSNTRFQSGTSYGVRDTLAGGAGNDSYWITYGSNGGTLNGAYVLENANEGIDTVHTTFTYTLTANVENMVVEATTGVTGTGNGLDNSIIGNAGNDQLIGAAGNDYISGDDGDDVLNGGTGSDTLVGGNGTDIAAYDEATTAVTIDRYHGIYTGEAAGDVYIGIEGFRGSDNNDNFVLGVENLTLNGGAGLDVASYANSTTGVTVTLTNHAGTVDHDGSYSDTLAAIEQVTGSAFDDTFTSNTRFQSGTSYGVRDTLAGGAGNDSYWITYGSNGGTLNGAYVLENANEGIDTVHTTFTYTLTANVENMVVEATTGVTGTGNGLDNSIIGNAGNDQLIGLDGNDYLVGGAGSDTLNGGNGSDTIAYTNSSAVSINLATLTASGGDATGDVLLSIENAVGSASNDTLTGNAGVNYLAGLAGNDVLSGADGDDVLDGGAGTDTISGGNGTDTVTYAASTAAINVNLVTGVNTGGDASGDVLSGIEVVIGSNFGDTFTAAGMITLEGGTGNDTYVVNSTGVTVVEFAGEGIDIVQTSLASYTLDSNVENLLFTGAGGATLTGNSLDNTLSGGVGNDVLSGGDGNDLLLGGAGADSLTGGLGTDTVSYAAASVGIAANLVSLGGSSGDAAGDTYSGIEIVIGSNFADTLTAGSSVTLIGGAGDDVYVVNGAGVVITEAPGAGTDTVQTTLTNFSLDNNLENLTYSGTAATTLNGNSLANVLTGGTGNDLLIGGQGADILVGGSGLDTASYSSSSAAISVNVTGLIVSGGDATGDTLSGIEAIIGTAFGDTFTAASASTLTGGAGDDLYIINGTGVTLAEAAANGTDTVQTTLNTYTLASNIENLLFLGSGDATLTGSNVANIITSGSGNDILTGGTGDTLIGGTGDDVYVIGGTGITVNELAAEGIDTELTSLASLTLASHIENLTYTGTGPFTGTGNDLDNIMTGSSGNDVLIGGTGADTLFGGSGLDTASYATATAAITINLATGIYTGDAAGDLYSSIESIVGTSYDDTFHGDNGNNAIFGGSGTDTFLGDLGADTLNGGSGSDTIDYSASSGAIAINLTAGTGIGGDADGDTLISIEKVIGTSFSDTFAAATSATFVGGLGDDAYVVNSAGILLVEASGEGTDAVATTLTTYSLGNNLENLSFSGSGNATLTGNSLGNIVSGSAGNDHLDGASGSDIIVGAGGGDVLTGGDGADTFKFTSASDSSSVGGIDTIADFSQADIDRIDLSGLGGLTFVGTAAFTDTTGELRYELIDGDTFVFADFDGDGSADFEVQVNGAHTLTATDFNL